MKKTHYHVTDIAKLEGVHPETVRRWIREGVLPIQKRRGAKNAALISVEDYRQFQATQEGLSPLNQDLLQMVMEKKIQMNHHFPLCVGQHYSFATLCDLIQDQSGSTIKTNGTDVFMIFDTSPDGGDEWESHHLIKKGKPLQRTHGLKDRNYVLYQAHIEQTPVDAFMRKETNVYVYVGQFEVTSYLLQSSQHPTTFILTPLFPKEENRSRTDMSKQVILERLNALDASFQRDKHPYLCFEQSQEMSHLLKELYNYCCQLCNPLEGLTKSPALIEIHDLRNYKEVIQPTSITQTSGQYILTNSQQAVVCCANHHQLLHASNKPFHTKDNNLTNDLLSFPLYLNEHFHIV